MKKQLQNIFSYIESGLIERTVPVRLSLLAALSGEHLLLLGPPGTAKSEMARKLCNVFSNINYFERLLTRFSVPEELFGPLSIKALEEDRFQRLTQRYLPDASVAFIDEIFKANSAILNSLLTILNEREFDNGNVREKIPLISVIAASNELPEDESLDALFDRFMIRYQVKPVTQEKFASLLNISAASIHDSQIEKLSVSDIENIQKKAASIKLNKKSHDLFCDLRIYLSNKSVYISDRRWRKALKILQVCAFTNDKSEVNEWDCLLLAHILWQQPEQIADLNNWFIEYLSLDINASAKRIEKLVLAWENKLEEDKKKSTHKTNANGALLYKTPEGKITTQYERVSLAERNNEVLFLAPADQKDRTNQGKGYTLTELENNFFDESYKQTHIDGRWVDVQNYINNTQNRLVNRISFEALVEPFYFSQNYIDNQCAELSDVIDDVKSICAHYKSMQLAVKKINENHIWLKGGLIERIGFDIEKYMPELTNCCQRFQSIHYDINSLKVKGSVKDPVKEPIK